MTDNDEQTKEHPVFPDAPPPGEPLSAGPLPADPPEADPTAAVPSPAVPSPAVPSPAVPSPAVPSPAPRAADPLEPTTTVHVAPVAPAAYPQTPNQAWSGPPPGAANLPGQWQGAGRSQPGYGAPDYGQPGYGQPGYNQAGYGAPAAYPAAQAYGASTPTYGTSVFVALAAMLLVVMGIALAVLGAWLLTQGPQLSDLVQRLRSVDLVVFEPTREQLRAVVSASPGALMVLGALQLLVGALVLGHRGWARWLGVVLGLLGLLFSVVALTSTMALVPGASIQLVLAIAFLIAYAFVVLALIAGSGHFRARYPGR